MIEKLRLIFDGLRYIFFIVVCERRMSLLQFISIR